MKRKIRVGLWVVAAGVAVNAVLLNVLAYNHAYAMTHFEVVGAPTDKPERLKPAGKLEVLLRGVRVARPMGDKVPADLDPACGALTIDRGGGVTLSAWYCGRGKDAPLVVVLHGYAKEKTFLVPEAKAFLLMGASVLLVDFQGSGGSAGSDTTIGVREAGDVAAAVSYAKERLPHASLVLYGQSMGAVAILRAVRDGAVAPDAVILEAAFDTLLNTVRNRFKAMGVPSFPSAELLVFWGGVQAGFNGFTHNPAEYAMALRCPALFLHGSDDTRVSVAEARRVFEAAPEPKAFRVFQDAGHESLASRYPDEWRREVTSFLKGGKRVQHR